MVDVESCCSLWIDQCTVTASARGSKSISGAREERRVEGDVKCPQPRVSSSRGKSEAWRDRSNVPPCRTRLHFHFHHTTLSDMQRGIDVRVADDLFNAPADRNETRVVQWPIRDVDTAAHCRRGPHTCRCMRFSRCVRNGRASDGGRLSTSDLVLHARVEWVAGR